VANLYLTEQNSILRKSGDRLIVQKEDEVLLEVQCHKIDAVLIFGNVQFTTQAVHELFEHDIEMAIFSRTGRLKGQLTSPATKNITLRVQQFKKYDDDAFRLTLSRAFVSGKINNCLTLMRLFSYNHPEIDFKAQNHDLKVALVNVESADRLDSLLGLEGAAAKTYFNAFSRMILGEFCFKGRKKRPPTDPVNAMLSLSYTMIFNEVSSLLDGLGFDPYLGYFHSVDYGRASLAADIMEEFRAPIADRLILNLINNRVFKLEDFYANPKNGGINFKKDALKRYFREYEKMVNNEFIHPETQQNTTLRKCIRIQAEKLASVVQDNNPYTPFMLEI
jgi:CRISPR-associated protein Cas1